jgi:hypothetical protein
MDRHAASLAPDLVIVALGSAAAEAMFNYVTPRDRRDTRRPTHRPQAAVLPRSGRRVATGTNAGTASSSPQPSGTHGRSTRVPGIRGPSPALHVEVDDNGQVKLPIEYSQRVYDARIAADE